MKTQHEVIISAEGLKKIEQELHQLRTVHRKRVADRIRDALEFGDSAENNEFEDAKNEQAMVEGKIEELKRIVASAVVLDDSEVTTDEVGIGCIVTVKDNETNDEWEWSIVGTFEADPAEGKISNESPVGQALVGKKVGDMVTVEIPAGIAQYEIVGIRK
ncbi:MAG: transcription elongation factor GreA [Armatimonadota bacterium]